MATVTEFWIDKNWKLKTKLTKVKIRELKKKVKNRRSILYFCFFILKMGVFGIKEKKIHEDLLFIFG